MSRFSLRGSVATLEDSIIVLSGPALAISGIIAGVDLVTGGHLLTQVGWLTLAWAITLLLTLDFQVLALGVRGKRVYSSGKTGRRKALEIALIVIIAAGISLVSIQMSSIIARVNAEGLTIDAAAAQLGINTIALIWERSTLVLVLIFMSGWLRETDHQIEQSPGPPAMSDETMQQILARLAKVDELEAQLARVSVQEAPAALIEGPANRKQMDEAPAQSTDELPIYNGKFLSKEPAIRAALAAMPDASVESIAQAVQCSPRTAQRWMEKIRSGQA